MKKIGKYVLLIILVMVLLYSSIYTISAYTNTKTLYYNGKSKSFEYVNATAFNFFDDFNEIMPGDTLTNTVTIKAKNITNKSTMFLKIENFFDNADLPNDVVIKLYNNDELIYNSDDDGDKEIKIKEFTRNDEVSLKLVIYIKTTAGNELEELKTSLGWTFMIEEDGKLSVIPKTFDKGIFTDIVLLVVSLLAIALLLRKKVTE